MTLTESISCATKFHYFWLLSYISLMYIWELNFIKYTRRSYLWSRLIDAIWNWIVVWTNMLKIVVKHFETMIYKVGANKQSRIRHRLRSNKSESFPSWKRGWTSVCRFVCLMILLCRFVCLMILLCRFVCLMIVLLLHQWRKLSPDGEIEFECFHPWT